MKRKVSFEDVGLPEGHAYPELMFHSPTGLILAHTRPVTKSRLPCRRLSLRRVNEARYHPITNFPPSISVESFVVHPRLPLLFLITFVLSEHVNGPVGGDWEALYRFDLNTLKNEMIARRGELVLPDGYHRAWLNELLSVNEAGTGLFCKAGLRNGEPVHYCLTELSPADRKLVIITRLEAVFA